MANLLSDDELTRDSLELKYIINGAHVLPAKSWPPPAGLPSRHLQDLKDAIAFGELPAGLREGRPERFWLVRVRDLQVFLRSKPNGWDWLRRFVERWAEVQGGDTQHAKPTEPPLAPQLLGPKVKLALEALDASYPERDLFPPTEELRRVVESWLCDNKLKTSVSKATLERALRERRRRGPPAPDRSAPQAPSVCV